MTAALDGQAAAGGSVVLGGSPGTPAANPKTGTVYVPIQCTSSFCRHAPGHVVDVIDAATCNAKAGRLPGRGHGPRRKRPARGYRR